MMLSGKPRPLSDEQLVKSIFPDDLRKPKPTKGGPELTDLQHNRTVEMGRSLNL
jgi:hypothetical protein